MLFDITIDVREMTFLKHLTQQPQWFFQLQCKHRIIHTYLLKKILLAEANIYGEISVFNLFYFYSKYNAEHIYGFLVKMMTVPTATPHISENNL